MSPVIAHLQDLGWKLPKPDLWISPEGDQWAFDQASGLEAFLLDFRQSVRHKVWKGVGHTHQGQGATEGIDPTVALKYLSKLE
eukprot:6108223-Heterocapsa_arctica.AAC.1